MLSEAFDCKTSLPVKAFSRFMYADQLRDRLIRLVEQKVKPSHTMLVAFDDKRLGGDDNVLGFAEMGMLQLPKERVPLSTADDDILTFDFWQEKLGEKRAIPTIGNLVVASTVRRCGIASRLMAAVEEEARRGGEQSLLIAVDPSNRGAVALYTHQLGYEPYAVAPINVREGLSEMQKEFTILVKELVVE